VRFIFSELPTCAEYIVELTTCTQAVYVYSISNRLEVKCSHFECIMMDTVSQATHYDISLIFAMLLQRLADKCTGNPVYFQWHVYHRNSTIHS